MKENKSVLVKSAMLLALTLVFQIGFNMFAQPIVGPLVNMMLIASSLLVGVVPAIIIGCLTPVIAFGLGIMPLFPVVPFIMIGNSLMILLFHYSRLKLVKKDYIAVLIGAVGKFGFLAFSVRYLLVHFVPKVPPKLVVALSLPQLYTAIVGGLVALIVVNRLPFIKQKDRKI